MLKAKVYIVVVTTNFNMIIKKVWKAKKKNQLLITIPKGEGIKAGDYVKVVRIKKNAKI